jgi:hypothetical protein
MYEYRGDQLRRMVGPLVVGRTPWEWAFVSSPGPALIVVIAKR